MKRIVRGLQIITLAVAFMFCANVLAGCGGNNDEEVLREGISAELDNIKNLDDELLDSMTAAIDNDLFSTIGIDEKEFMSSYLEGFDYSIEEIKVNGKKATATVVLTCKSFNSYIDTLTEEANSLNADGSLDGLTSDEANAMIGQMIMDCISTVKVAETEPIELSYELIDNTWTAADSNADVLTAALFGN